MKYLNRLIAWICKTGYPVRQEVAAMANEDKKDFNGMLHDSKDMPKFQTITDKKSIEKYGGGRVDFGPPPD